MKHVALIAMGVTLAGCQPSGFDRGFVGRADLTTGSVAPLTPLSPEVAVDPALALPVEAGGVVRVRERHYPNGTRQEIVLAGASSGENVLEVSIRTSGGDEAGPGFLQIGKPSQRGVAIETAARFPGLKMLVVTRPMSNAFGPFGLAVGRRETGERCVFAWQWIDDLRGETGAFGGLLSSGTAAASVRLRICRNNMTLDEIAATMEGLRRGAPAAIERIVRMDRRGLDAPRMAMSAPMGMSAPMEVAAPVAPMVGMLESAVPVSAAPPAPRIAAPPPPPRRVAARPRPTREAARPRPPVRAVTRPQEAAEPAWISAQQPLAGPRYLAPVGAVATGSMPTGATGPVRSGLAPGLPSRAYLGPGSGAAY